MDTNTTQNYVPKLYRLSVPAEKEAYDTLLKRHPECRILDYYEHQQKEIFKIESPASPPDAAQLEERWQTFISTNDPALVGVWVYYSWLNTMVHILDKDAFVQLRTSRNQHKITAAEQQLLMGKRIGIIGLSVGHAVALTIAAERIAGHLKLADFDTIDLSNLNRIRTGVQNVGLNKCIVTAREIAELDPFLEVECHTDGIHEGNIEAFLTEGGKLDLLLDECDSLDIKIMARMAARTLGIPVMMETSDKGMLDVERFDLEPQRPILHGKAEGINPGILKNLSTTEKIPLVLKITDALNGSVRGKASIIEIGQTIGTWPQLASAVAMGGAVVTDVSRRLLLGQFHESGRYYIDLEKLVGDATDTSASSISFEPTVAPLTLDDMQQLAAQLPGSASAQQHAQELITQIVEAGCDAPSTGNDQPWQWLYQEGRLHLFHDRFRSESFGDYRYIASDLTFGAVLENVAYKAAAMGVGCHYQLFPLGHHSPLVASIDLPVDQVDGMLYRPELVQYIKDRCTNRNGTLPEPLDAAEIQLLQEAAESINGARHYYFADRQQVMALGNIIGNCDRIRLLNPRGHYDFVRREMRWTPQHAEQTRDGIDIRTLGLLPAQQAALMMVNDPRVVSVLEAIDGGKALIHSAMYLASTASGFGIITLPGSSRADYINGGRAMERLWLAATGCGLAMYPLISPFYLFPRIIMGSGEGLSEKDIQHLHTLIDNFHNITAISSHETGMYLYKIGKADSPAIRSLRIPVQEVLHYVAQ